MAAIDNYTPRQLLLSPRDSDRLLSQALLILPIVMQRWQFLHKSLFDLPYELLHPEYLRVPLHVDSLQAFQYLGFTLDKASDLLGQWDQERRQLGDLAAIEEIEKLGLFSRRYLESQLMLSGPRPDVDAGAEWLLCLDRAGIDEVVRRIVMNPANRRLARMAGTPFVGVVRQQFKLRWELLLQLWRDSAER